MTGSALKAEPGPASLKNAFKVLRLSQTRFSRLDGGAPVGGEELFEKCEPSVKELYDSLMERIRLFGPLKIEAKKTSLHVLNRAAFLGIHPKKRLLEINIVSEKPIVDERVITAEQVSKSRYHNRFRLTEKNQIDSALVSLLRDAYRLLA
jgi:hypothetical protein